jgi:histone-lysine N-methyltransferase SETD3
MTALAPRPARTALVRHFLCRSIKCLARAGPIVARASPGGYAEDHLAQLQYCEDPASPSGSTMVSKADLPAGTVLLSLPGDLAATLTDVEQDEELGDLVQAAACSELVSLALFVAKHRALSESPWRALMDSLPSSVDSPVFWSDEERAALLRGSPVVKEAKERYRALELQWDALSQAQCPAWLTKERFMECMSVVLSHAVYLPSVGCFALLPIIGDLEKTGSESGAVVDYDRESNMVTVTSSISVSVGDPVKVYDGRPNGELFMATGCVERVNPSDFMTLNASLVQADRLYTMKEEVATAMGFSSSVDFPIFEDRFTMQHLAYLRMSRLTDPAQMAKVSFEDDVIISQENEYEILQL